MSVTTLRPSSDGATLIGTPADFESALKKLDLKTQVRAMKVGETIAF